MIPAPAIRERGIVLTAHEVRGIIAGTLTQLRRVVKPQPEHDRFIGPELYAPERVGRDGILRDGPEVLGIYDPDGEWGIACPFGQPGSRLWGKETWGQIDAMSTDIRDSLLYRADDNGRSNDAAMRGYWKSSTSMPRELSRITLEVTGVRVERADDERWYWVADVRRAGGDA